MMDTRYPVSKFRLLPKEWQIWVLFWVLAMGTFVFLLLQGCQDYHESEEPGLKQGPMDNYRRSTKNRFKGMVPRPSSARAFSRLSGETYEIGGKTYHVLARARGYVERGEATWYGRRFHGRKTANGEEYDMYALTAAHKTLPFGTLVKVTNLINAHVVIVRINDRGPFFSEDRIIDLSRSGAETLSMLEAGHAPVLIEVIDPVRPPKKPWADPPRDSQTVEKKKKFKQGLHPVLQEPTPSHPGEANASEGL